MDAGWQRCGVQSREAGAQVGRPGRPGWESVWESGEEGGGKRHEMVAAGSVNPRKQRESGVGTGGSRADKPWFESWPRH